MPRYDYACPCGRQEARDVTAVARDAQVCVCGWPIRRLPHYTSIAIGVPAGFKTMFSDVHGIPGSPQREQFEKDVKSGEIQYAGPGARWV